MNIVISGASSGVGYELAKYLCKEESNHLFVFARRKDKLEKLENEIAALGGKERISFKTFDLEKNDISKELVPDILDTLDGVDVLVNNAGLLITKSVSELTGDDFDRLFQVNVKSVFLLVKALLPHFSMNAHIVNLGSMGGVQGSAKFPGLSLYSSSKAAVSVLTECLAEELKDRNIRSNALAIGAVQTEMLESAFPGYKAPLQPEEMAKFVGDFAMTGHHYFNGKILPVSISTP
jgi:NAD(P)-dependent dehydrogenase (short-subunit alcohol dehydrogenase family)